MIVQLVKIVKENTEKFSVKTNMTGDQIAQFASDFMDFHEQDSFEDLIMAFKYARMGKFGSTYQTIDSLTIMNWFNQYLDMKYAEKPVSRDHIKGDKIKIESVKKGYERIAKEQVKKVETPEQKKQRQFENWVEGIRMYRSSYTNEQLEEIWKQCLRNHSKHFLIPLKLIQEEFQKRGIKKEIPGGLQ